MSRSRVLTQIRLQPEAYAVLEPHAEIVTSPDSAADVWYADASRSDAVLVSGLTYMTGPVMDRIGLRLQTIYL